MATYTDNLKLKKPDETDFVDVADINQNMDAVDAAIAENKQKISELNNKIDDTDAAVQSNEQKFTKLENSINTVNQQVTETKEAVNANVNKFEELSKSVDEKINNAFSDKNITNEIVSVIDGYIGYEDSDDILGLQIDFENKKFTRLAGAAGLNTGIDFDKFNMYGGRKRCMVANNGTIMAFCGDADYVDSTFPHASPMPDPRKQIMVYQPKFYYKVVPLKLEKIKDGLGYHIRKANYYISNTQKSGFKLHPAFYDKNGNEVEYILFSAYEGSYWDDDRLENFEDWRTEESEMDFTHDMLNSLNSTKPISGAIKNLTKTNFELLAQSRGDKWHLETIKTLSANQLLMMIEFGTTNFQNIIGKGVVSFPSNSSYNASSQTGSTSELGNTTGVATETMNVTVRGNVISGTAYSEDGKVAVSYRGMENPWGNLYKHINGINIWGDGSMLGGQPYIADDFDFDATKNNGNYHPAGFTLPNGAGYISAMGYGSEKYDWLLMPSEVEGDSSLPVGDYTDATADLNGYRTVLQGGAYYNNLAAGIFDYYCAAGVTTKSRNFGGRLVYIPTAE